MITAREQELQKLNQLWNSGEFRLVHIYGDRGVGKTALISEFAKDKETVYFCAVESCAANNLENLHKCVCSLDGHTDTGVPLSFANMMDNLCERAGERRIILVLDEFQYLTSSVRGLADELKKIIDDKLRGTKHMLILCYAASQMKAPFTVGGKTVSSESSIKVRPLDFFGTRKFYGSLSPSEAVVIYALTGGVPKYLSYVDAGLLPRQIIQDLFLSVTAPLLEEPVSQLRREVREPAFYNAVLRAIARGNVRMSGIAEKSGLGSSACAEYLKNLTAMGLVKKEYPFGEENTRKAFYIIPNLMRRFWYRFIPDNMSHIQNGKPGRALEDIMTGLDEFINSVFSDVCRQWLLRENANKRLPIAFSAHGRWLDGKNGIDIIASSDENNAIFGDCRWIDERVGVRILDSLVRRSEYFKYRNKYLFLFSKSGFTEDCEAKAAQLRNVKMVAF